MPAVPQGFNELYKRNYAADVLYSIKSYLGSSYTCDNVHDSEDIKNFGFDMRNVNSCIYEDDSISAINYDLAIVVNVKDGYADKAVQILQDYYQQILSVSKLYDADVYRVEHFISELTDYIDWYNNKRIKLKLDGLSPVEYRHRAA